MPRFTSDSSKHAQIGIKRTSRGKTLPAMVISKQNKPVLPNQYPQTDRKLSARPRRGKRKSFDSFVTDSVSDAVPVFEKRRPLSDSTFVGGSQDLASGLKIEAFDYFHETLNQCCGEHKLNVFEAASILKQFTPEVIKTVIYVIAENAKKNVATQLQEGQSQTIESDEFPDIEISNITSGAATRKRNKGKWHPQELVQPRLTSPVSNSCSPVSAAVQALMSFASRPDAKEKSASEIDDVSNSDLISNSDNKEERHADVESEKAELNVFDTDSMTVVSSSPFLQPMSSMVMLHTEPEKLQNTSDALSTEPDQDRPSFVSSIRDTLTASSSCMSPHFPWTQSPTSKASSEKEKTPKDKYLPSISSILGPINTPFSELPFSMPSTMPVFGLSKTASKITASQSSFPQSQLPTDNAASGVNHRAVLQNPSSASSIHTTSASANSKNQNMPKTVFRTILPKPIDKITSSPSTKSELKIKTENLGTKSVFNFLTIDSISEQGKNQSFGHDVVPEDQMSAISQCMAPEMLTSLAPKPVLLAPFNKQGALDKERQNVLSKPLYGIINPIRERGVNFKNVPSKSASNTGAKGKKTNTSGNNSGNLEVASALLSMSDNSTDNKGKKSAKVVSSFNKEKATFDIEESSQAQRGNILFTATGTFQIEDIEIDPKKNKIEKDSYECGKCGRVFTSLVYLARHIKRVCPDMTLRKWKCDRCEKAFRHPFGLQQHIYTHTGERPFKCDQCTKAFYSANDLRRHQRTHSGERPYSCSHCKKSFSTTISLKTHTYIHTGERPHRCPHCPKTFATSSKLSRHVVTHSDKRPFSCDLCVKTFNRSGDLRRHYSNVHNIEHGLMSCDQCNKRFATQKCLQNHKATHNRVGREKTGLDGMPETGDDASISELMPGDSSPRAER